MDSRCGNTVSGYTRTSTARLHQSRRHSPPSHHTPGWGPGRQKSGTGTRNSRSSPGGLERMTFCLYSQTTPPTPLPAKHPSHSKALSCAYNQDASILAKGWISGPAAFARWAGFPRRDAASGRRPFEAICLLPLHLHPASSLPSLQSLCPSQRQGSGTHWSPLAQGHCLEPQRSSSGSQSWGDSERLGQHHLHSEPRRVLRGRGSLGYKTALKSLLQRDQSRKSRATWIIRNSFHSWSLGKEP